MTTGRDVDLHPVHGINVRSGRPDARYSSHGPLTVRTRKLGGRRGVLAPRPPPLITHLGTARSSVANVPPSQPRVSKVFEVASCRHTRGAHDPRQLDRRETNGPIGRTQLPHDRIQRLGTDPCRQVVMIPFAQAGQQIVYLRLPDELPAASEALAVITVASETLSHHRERNRFDKAIECSVAQGRPQCGGIVTPNRGNNIIGVAVAADHAQQLEAAHVGRVDIEQNQVYFVVPQLPYRVSATPGLSEDGESKEAGRTVDLRETTVWFFLDDQDPHHVPARLPPCISRTSGTAARSAASTVNLRRGQSTWRIPVPGIARTRCRIPNTPTHRSLRDAVGVQDSTRPPGRDLVTCKQQGSPVRRPCVQHGRAILAQVRHPPGSGQVRPDRRLRRRPRRALRRTCRGPESGPRLEQRALHRWAHPAAAGPAHPRLLHPPRRDPEPPPHPSPPPLLYPVEYR